MPIDYLSRTRDADVNVLFLMPWVLVYLVCYVTLGSEVENQVASTLGSVLRGLPRRGRILAALTAALALATFLRVRRRAPRRGDGPVLTGMLLEGVVYGLLLELVSWGLARALPVGRYFAVALAGPFGLSEMRVLGIAVGAGIFEELLFRGVLCLGLYHLLRAGLGRLGATPSLRAALAGTASVVVSAAVFSAYHHVGAGGEPYDALRFAFRFHAGVVLGAIFLTRGLGIAACAHGFYDVLVLLDAG